MKRWHISTRIKLGLALLISSLTSVALWAAGIFANGGNEFGFLNWNLALAWIPLILALWLERILYVKPWSSWQPLLVTFLWLGFLPNSFYILTDLIHLIEAPRTDVVFDALMISSFAINGLLLGYSSLLLVHSELRKRLDTRACLLLIGGVLFLSSFAIYIGRVLRWNTWDLIINPASLLVDVSERLLNISSHSQMISVTFGSFVLLTSVYAAIFYAGRVAQKHKSLFS